MTMAHVGLSMYAGAAYGAMERGSCGALGCLGSGYSTRPAFLREVVGGPLVFLREPRWGMGHTLFPMLIVAPAVFVFWWWIGCLLEGWRVHRRVPRIVLAILALFVSALVLWNIRPIFDHAIVNGAGEWRNWRMLCSGRFIPDSLVRFIHGVWMLLLVAVSWFTVLRGSLDKRPRPAVGGPADPSSPRSSG